MRVRNAHRVSWVLDTALATREDMIIVILHSDTLTEAQILAAVRQAGAYAERLTTHRSRSRTVAFDLVLSGDSPRPANSGTRGANAHKAASWDQWGIVLAAMYSRDPHLVTPYYADAEQFHAVTVGRFDPVVGITSRTDPRYHANHRWNAPTDFRGRECRCGAQRSFSEAVSVPRGQ